MPDGAFLPPGVVKTGKAGSLTGSTLASGVTASSLTSVGTIATGVWQGTDVGVPYGGTGVSTLADNAVLTGTGASAITAEANLTFDGSTLTLDGDLTFTGAQTISTSTGNLTLTAGSSTGDVLIGDGDGTILYVDGGTGTVGVGEAASSTAPLAVGGTFQGDSFTAALRVTTALTDPAGQGTNSAGVYIATNFTDVVDTSTPTRASLRVIAPTINGGGAGKSGTSVTNLATVYIAGAPSGGATPTNGPHSIFVDAGTTRLDGGIKINTESADALISEGPSGSGTVTHYIGNEIIDTTASDMRVKENIEPFNDSVMPLLTKMKVSEFNFIGAPGETILGLMAQEVDEYAPELVKKGPTPEDTMAVKYNYMVPYLVKAIQELNERMEA